MSVQFLGISTDKLRLGEGKKKEVFGLISDSKNIFSRPSLIKSTFAICSVFK